MNDALQPVVRRAVVVTASSGGDKSAPLLSNQAALEVIGTVRSADDALALVRSHRPDLVILIVGAGSDRVSRTCRSLAESGVAEPMLALESSRNDRILPSLLGAGISGYLTSPVSSADLARAVKDVTEGRLAFSPPAAGTVRSLLMEKVAEASRGPSQGLSRREMEIVECLSFGLGNQAIAEKLEISEKTVHAHVRHVLLKLGVRSRTEAAVLAVRRGWC